MPHHVGVCIVYADHVELLGQQGLLAGGGDFRSLHVRQLVERHVVAGDLWRKGWKLLTLMLQLHVTTMVSAPLMSVGLLENAQKALQQAAGLGQALRNIEVNA